MNFLADLVFWFFVVLTVSSAIVVVFHKKIIYSAFALLFTFFGVAALYLFLSADFLAVSQVLIYVGGILTLIIFGVFLTSRITTLAVSQLMHQKYMAIIPVVVLGVSLIAMVYKANWRIQPLDSLPTTQAIGEALLTRYLVPFELASILLLAALIGAMRLARFFRGES